MINTHFCNVHVRDTCLYSTQWTIHKLKFVPISLHRGAFCQFTFRWIYYYAHGIEIVGEWVMNRQPFWIKIFHISPILLGRFCDKKVWKLLSVLCSLWEIFGRENLQCVFSLQTLQCAMFLFSYNLA